MILTTRDYWLSIPVATRNYWLKVSLSCRGVLVCTHRPPAVRIWSSRRKIKPPNTALVRRCSTGGRYGKSTDYAFVAMEDLAKFQTPEQIEAKLAARRDEVYSNDEH